MDKISRQRQMKRACRIFLFPILGIMLVLAGCIPGTPTPFPPRVTPDADSTSSWLNVYFTDPGAPNAADYEGGPDEALAAAIDGARLSVDMAAYTLNLWSIRDALLDAHQRGVVVRMVMESDNMDSSEVEQIREAGIPVIGDQREGLMHNKFVVIDRSEVWTGSMNYSVGAAYHDNNNLLCIHSSQVAEDYLFVFNEMFEQNLFGASTRAPTANPDLVVEGTPINVYFSPEDGIAQHLLDLIQNAQKSISFLAYAFTSDELGDALRQREAAGVHVSGVMDSEQINSNQGGEYDRFMQAGLDIHRDGNEGLMHNKVIIIDEKIVITGSYNFTASAEEANDENVVILDNPEIAAQYLAEFRRIYDQGQP
jgi:phosphatidylserine/phosphatidylglycerophosphate/cardiolipin synthase-like enzyme